MERSKERKERVVTNEQHWWKGAGRNICYQYADEYGTQYLLFQVLGGKRLKLSSHIPSHRLKYIRTERNAQLEEGWVEIKPGDYLFR